MITHIITVKQNFMFSEQKPKLSVSAISKIFLAAVILICFSTVLGVAGYLAVNKSALGQKTQVLNTPEPTATSTLIVKDETADWQIYRNEEYGFEVRYPKNYRIDPFGLSGSPAHPEMMIYTSDYSVDIRLGVFDNIAKVTGGDNLSLEDWLLKTSKDPYVMGEYNIEYINGLKVYRVRWPGITVTEMVYVEHNGEVYYLNIEENLDQSIIKTFDQILSTFKFIEK